MIFYLPIWFLSHPICTIGVALPFILPTACQKRGQDYERAPVGNKNSTICDEFQIIIIILHRIFSIIAGNVPT